MGAHGHVWESVPQTVGWFRCEVCGVWAVCLSCLYKAGHPLRQFECVELYWCSQHRGPLVPAAQSGCV